MLPLLPALILFLLNGPANIERLAEGGALPAMLAAIQQRIDSAPSIPDEARRSDPNALASLLRLSADPRVSHALVRILVLGVDASPLHESEPPPTRAKPEAPPASDTIGQPHSGFLRSQRSRDGPVAL